MRSFPSRSPEALGQRARIQVSPLLSHELRDGQSFLILHSAVDPQDYSAEIGANKSDPWKKGQAGAGEGAERETREVEADKRENRETFEQTVS